MESKASYKDFCRRRMQERRLERREARSETRYRRLEKEKTKKQEQIEKEWEVLRVEKSDIVPASEPKKISEFFDILKTTFTKIFLVHQENEVRRSEEKSKGM